MNNAFEIYEQLRKQQVHYDKIVNPQVRVPGHAAYKPIKAKIQETRLNQRLKKQTSIQRQNVQLMKKLFSINKRRPQLCTSNSTPSLCLPPIMLKKKAFMIPAHEASNNLIAQKLISSKSNISVRSQLLDFHKREKIKQKLSKYLSLDCQLVDRKRYIAQLMMLKKLKISGETESQLKQYISGNARVSKFDMVKGRDNPEKAYYTNK